jgi:hypothetical protein
MRCLDSLSASRRPTAPGASTAWAATLLSLLVLGLPAPAVAASSGRAPAEVSPVAKERAAPAVRRHRGARPAVQRTSSDESSAERDRRLARECRGLPNAGACLGYTR